MAFITQFYSYSTGDVLTAARLNGNITNIISGLDGGAKDINVGTIQIGGTEIVDGSRNATLNKLIFRDSDIFLNSSTDGQLDLNADGEVFINKTTALTSTVSYLTIEHTTSGTPAAGIGAGITFNTETSASNTETGMIIDSVTTDVAATREDFDMVVKLMSGGAAAAERFRIKSNGDVGFNASAISSLGANITTLHSKGTAAGRSGGLRLGSSDDSIEFQISGATSDSANDPFGLGTLTNHGFAFITNSSRVGLIDKSGNFVIGSGELADAATDGFLYIPTTTAGAPSGTPTSYSGRVPMVYDDTNNKLYIYNSSWKSVTLS